MSTTRRDFVSSVTGFGALWLAAAVACRNSDAPPTDRHGPLLDSPEPARVLRFLTPEEAKEVEAIAARIIPTDETPGAREAGVIWFIDGALATFGEESQQVVREALPALAIAVAKKHPGRARFSGLTEAEQDAFLHGYEKEPLFGILRFGTIAGMFTLPKYGGNKDWIGWELIGQERVFEYKPPFGWYDRPENQRALLGRVL